MKQNKSFSPLKSFVIHSFDSSTLPRSPLLNFSWKRCKACVPSLAPYKVKHFSIITDNQMEMKSISTPQPQWGWITTRAHPKLTQWPMKWEHLISSHVYRADKRCKALPCIIWGLNDHAFVCTVIWWMTGQKKKWIITSVDFTTRNGVQETMDHTRYWQTIPSLACICV